MMLIQNLVKKTLEEPLRKHDSDRGEKGASFRFVLFHQQISRPHPAFLAHVKGFMSPGFGTLPSVCPQPLKSTQATWLLGKGV